MKKIILMGIPHHGNIGDNAIAIAEENMLRKFFPKLEVIQFPESGLVEKVFEQRELINDEDTILFHGGGNLGDIYEVPEKGRREIIKLFPKNKIIVFPQTTFFKSNIELEKSKEIYNNHNNLIMMAREEKTYDFMVKNFNKCKIYLTPDIVMSMNKSENLERKNIVFLFRTDTEKTIANDNIERLKKYVEETYGEFILSDMNLGKQEIMYGKVREDELNKKFKQFNNAKLVITDRLHGMIFAAITETPCVALDSFTHKTSESYKWLKNLEYIELCNDFNCIEDKIKKVMFCKDRHYDNSFAEETISNILLNEI